jgi:hypothetical protein
MMDDVVSSYVVSHLVNGGNTLRCGDGRYTGYHIPGTTARFGGAFGYAEAVLALDELYHWNKDGRYYLAAFQKALPYIQGDTVCHFHSDEGNSIGCAHASKATNLEHAHLYGTDPQKVEALYRLWLEKAQQKEGTHCIYLSGQHKEQALLINDVTAQTIVPNDPEQNLMFFVYDRRKDKEIAKIFATHLAESFPGLKFPEFWAMLERQTEATRSIVAEKLPIYYIQYDEDGKLQVERQSEKVIEATV